MVDDAVGRLVPPDDPHALATAIESLLDLDEPEWAAMGDRGRARVTEHFTMSAQVAKLRGILTAMSKESA
jgi:glycosyltransferase involved in cell wall biosynthesis